MTFIDGPKDNITYELFEKHDTIFEKLDIFKEVSHFTAYSLSCSPNTYHFLHSVARPDLLFEVTHYQIIDPE